MAADIRYLPAIQSTTTPIIGVCGATKPERKALLSFLVSALHRHGLKVVVTEMISGAGLETFLSSDLILMEGEHRLPTLIWLEDRRPPQLETGSVMKVFGPERQKEEVLIFLLEWIAQLWHKTPVWGCVLIGGQSSRMGRPKHLLTSRQGVTWLERTVGLLRPLVADLVISGNGDVPQSLRNLIRLSDVPGVAGPLSGILAAMFSYPEVSWLLVACDMPDIHEDAVRWLLARRRPGVWGTIPRLQEGSKVEPLFAMYDFRCAYLFQDLARTGCLRIGMLAGNSKIETPLVPESLRSSWRNVNSVRDLQTHKPVLDVKKTEFSNTVKKIDYRTIIGTAVLQ